MSETKLLKEFKVYCDDDMIVIQLWQDYQELKSLSPPYKQLIPKLPRYCTKRGDTVFKQKENDYYEILGKKYYEKDEGV